MAKVLEDTGQLLQEEIVALAAIQEHSELQNVKWAVVIQHNDGNIMRFSSYMIFVVLG